MKTLLLLALALPAGAAWRLPWREAADGRIRPVQALHDQNRSKEVVATLQPDFMQKLRGKDLRQAYVLLGENLDRLGRADDAVGVYQLGVKLFPDNVDLLTRQAGLLHRSGMLASAKPLYLKALIKEPRHAGANLGLAEIFRTQSFLEQSASHYEVALEELPERADIWGEYAEVLLAARDYRTADLALRRAVELAPADPQPRVLLAFALREQGDLPGALARLDEALALGADFPARRAKALWLIEAGRRADALKEADLVLKASPGDVAALWVRARARLGEGRKADALKELDALGASAPKDSFPARAAAALAKVLR